MFQKGMGSFYDMISSTARYGGLSRGKKLINNDFKSGIRKVLSDIKSGEFNKELEKSLSKGDDGSESFKKIFNSKDFNEIEKFLLKKIKR